MNISISKPLPPTNDPDVEGEKIEIFPAPLISPSGVGIMESIKSRSTVRMADYEAMGPHQSRDLLPQSIWRDILREGCLGILGGESKAKKSWFSLSLAMHAVSGRTFLGIDMLRGEVNRRALVLDFELLESNMMSRFLALTEAFQDDEEALRAIWQNVEVRCHRGMMAEAAPWLEYCREAIRQANRGDIVIVDCLQALPAGDVNDPAAVRSMLGGFQAAATESGAFVLAVDHFNKSTEARGKNRLSGSMAKAATPDAILLLESDGPFIRFSSELRMDRPRDPLTLEFESPSEGFRVVSSDEREDRKVAAKSSRDEADLGLLFPEIGGIYTKKQLAVNIGKSEKTAEAWIRRFGDSITTHQGTGNTPNRYSRNAN